MNRIRSNSMANQTLRPDGRPLPLEELGFVLVSTNLTARVETLPGSVPGTRSGGPGLTRPVLESADVRELGTVVLQDQHPERDQAKTVSLYAPAGGREDGRLLLYFDENGGVTFHAPQSEARPPAGVRAGREKLVRFEVPIRRPVQDADESRPVRGVGGMIAKKLLKVIGWKVAGAAARQVGPPLVRRWEATYRPLRLLDRTGLFEPETSAMAGPLPASLPVLLFVHGTFSRVASGFKGLDNEADFLGRLGDYYSDRIYGYDHPTVATGVATNVMQLYENLAPGRHNFDIICHSRGGLVARALRDLNEDALKARFMIDAQRGQYEPELIAWGQQWRIPAGVEVRVNRIFFAGTPNNGTVLAQPVQLKKYLDLLMTATNLLPDFVDVPIAAILIVAKLLLSDVMPVLPGLDDQRPGSGLFKQLRNRPGAKDVAIEANYEAPPGLQAVMRTADAAADFIFGQQQNDLVVPTEGVSQWSGGIFDQERLLSYTAGQSVHHCNLFSQAKTRLQIATWLTT